MGTNRAGYQDVVWPVHYIGGEASEVERDKEELVLMEGSINLDRQCGVAENKGDIRPTI